MDFDMEEVKRLVNDPGFAQYFLNNTTDLGAAAFILQTLVDKINEGVEL